MLIPVAYQYGNEIITHAYFNNYNSLPKIYLNCVSVKINNKTHVITTKRTVHGSGKELHKLNHIYFILISMVEQFWNVRKFGAQMLELCLSSVVLLSTKCTIPKFVPVVHRGEVKFCLKLG